MSASYDSPNAGPDRLDIWLQQTQARWECPFCQVPAPGIGQTRTRIFRRIIGTPETNIFLRVPIFGCPTHGAHEVRVPWAQKPEKWTHVGDLDD